MSGCTNVGMYKHLVTTNCTADSAIRKFPDYVYIHVQPQHNVITNVYGIIQQGQTLSKPYVDTIMCMQLCECGIAYIQPDVSQPYLFFLSKTNIQLLEIDWDALLGFQFEPQHRHVNF